MQHDATEVLYHILMHGWQLQDDAGLGASEAAIRKRNAV
jgi:hypothetical protein